LFSPNCTFLVSVENNGDGGVIFSNFQGDSIKSGFLFGINDANRLFFETFDNHGPVTYTSSTRLSKKNLLAVTLGSNNVSLSCFNNNTKGFETEAFSVQSEFILESDNWRI